MRTVSLFREQLIPAWAGKTAGTGGRSPSGASHPRAGGENERRRSRRRGRPGSSPRGRGKRIADLVEVIAERLIPARAGKTLRCISPPRTSAAHPRAGGENPLPTGTGARVGGSSPRGRGKLRRFLSAMAGRGLIPAWAGKTVAQVVRLEVLGAHPRVGGENQA